MLSCKGKEKKKNFLPLIALIYADQESFISFISVNQRDQRLNSSGFVFKHQGKEKEFLPLIASR
jgi:hypothetical protein